MTVQYKIRLKILCLTQKDTGREGGPKLIDPTLLPGKP